MQTGLSAGSPRNTVIHPEQYFYNTTHMLNFKHITKCFFGLRPKGIYRQTLLVRLLKKQNSHEQEAIYR